LGIPHEYQTDAGITYYIEALGRMKEKIESVTGTEITSNRLMESIQLYNEMRGLLKKIALLRKSSPPLIKTLDFIKLNHASYLLDPVVMVEHLRRICHEVEQKRYEAAEEKPRLLLLAPNIALGDYKIFDMVEEAGGAIVAEEVCEGTRAYGENVDTDGDGPLESLAFKYLRKRCPGCFMRQVMKTRLEYIIKLAQDYKVAGAIWYQLKFCETFDMEFRYVARNLNEHNLPVLKLDSEYDASERGQMKTRIEAFIESIERR
jgi:benzoyl-CoA reductase/2-hydroxyglutaryl-CoA dehydratase subunit BcrC/BadD/HgdB